MSEVNTNAEPLKFKVRTGLVVHRKRLLKLDNGGRKSSQVQTESFGTVFGAPFVELRSEEVKTYAHALEPTDDASAAALTELHYKRPQREAEVPYETRMLKDMAEALKVALELLVAHGVLVPKKAAKAD